MEESDGFHAGVSKRSAANVIGIPNVTSRRFRAAIGSIAFFIVAPGVAAGLVPWLLTKWHGAEMGAWWLPLRVAGAILVAAGAAVLVQAFARFVRDGLGTPAPVAPPERLVVGGWYRYVRNPMYLAVAAMILGQALILARAIVGAYLAVFVAAVSVFVRLYEEPTLRRRFGADYEEYAEAVPAWWPRRRPWRSMP